MSNKLSTAVSRQTKRPISQLKSNFAYEYSKQMKMECSKSLLGLIECPCTDAATLHQLTCEELTSLALTFPSVTIKDMMALQRCKEDFQASKFVLKETHPAKLSMQCAGYQVNLIAQDCFKSTKQGLHAISAYDGQQSLRGS